MSELIAYSSKKKFKYSKADIIRKKLEKNMPAEEKHEWRYTRPGLRERMTATPDTEGRGRSVRQTPAALTQ